MRLTVSIDPMPALKSAAAAVVNEHFNEVSASELHRDQAHRRKKAVAGAVAAGAGVDQYPEFFAEAELRGISALALAEIVLGFGDPMDQRELARQTLLLRIDACTTPAHIAAAKASILGLSGS